MGGRKYMRRFAAVNETVDLRGLITLEPSPIPTYTLLHFTIVSLLFTSLVTLVQIPRHKPTWSVHDFR